MSPFTPGTDENGAPHIHDTFPTGTTALYAALRAQIEKTLTQRFAVNVSTVPADHALNDLTAALIAIVRETPHGD